MHDFGRVRQGATLAREFRLANTTEKPLRIVRVVTNCSCTSSAPLAGEDVAPGESVALPMTWEIGDRREQTAVDALVEYLPQGAQRTEMLPIQLRAFVEPLFTVSPEKLLFRSGDSEAQKVRFRPTSEGSDVRLVDVRSTHPAFTATIVEEHPAAGEAVIVVDFDADVWESGTLVEAEVRLRTSSEIAPSFSVPLDVQSPGNANSTATRGARAMRR